MLIRLNEEEIQWDPQGQENLGDLIEEFVNKRFFKDEFISTVEVNGTAIPENQMGPARLKPVSDITSLQITTDTFRKVSIRAIESMEGFLDGLVTKIESSADKFRMEDEAEANKFFIGCVEAMQTFVEIIHKVKTLNTLDFDAISWNDSSMSKKETELLQVLNNLFQLQKKKDWISLADVLEYELSPLIAEWKEVLEAIAVILSKM